jgi:hypothetical protein
MTDVALLPAHGRAVEPELAFHPTRGSDRDVHPLSGLIKFGPYSRSLVNAVLDPIRVALVGPESRLTDLEKLVAELERKHPPLERKQYLPAFPGFHSAFGVRIVVAGPRVGLPDRLHAERHEHQGMPHVVLADRLKAALQRLAARRDEYDVVMLLLPSEWEPGFYGPSGDDFDLHDFLKAAGALLSVPTQVINEGRQGALGYRCRCSVAWRLAIALYTKSGGVPWKIADADEGKAYIGLSYALKGGDAAGGRFVTCCSQVFDSDGAGLEFVAYETGDVRLERDNPYLNRAEMRRVMARSLALYQRRHSGRSPRAVAVHKSTEFKEDEIEGCFDALRVVEDVELIHVQRDTLWRGVDIEAPAGAGSKGHAASYPCDRGIYQVLGSREILLWTQGNAKEASNGKDYFKEGKGIPAPLLLTRYAGRGGWSETCRALLGLTKMNWNNDGLYDRLPVTMAYAKTLADVVKRMPFIASHPYQVRFFM